VAGNDCAAGVGLVRASEQPGSEPKITAIVVAMPNVLKKIGLRITSFHFHFFTILVYQPI